MKCDNCKAEIDDSANVCKNCGVEYPDNLVFTNQKINNIDNIKIKQTILNNNICLVLKKYYFFNYTYSCIIFKYINIITIYCNINNLNTNHIISNFLFNLKNNKKYFKKNNLNDHNFYKNNLVYTLAQFNLQKNEQDVRTELKELFGIRITKDYYKFKAFNNLFVNNNKLDYMLNKVLLEKIINVNESIKFYNMFKNLRLTRFKTYNYLYFYIKMLNKKISVCKYKSMFNFYKNVHFNYSLKKDFIKIYNKKIQSTF